MRPFFVVFLLCFVMLSDAISQALDSAQWNWGIYADAYYAIYSDDTHSKYQKFPTVAPTSKTPGINMLAAFVNYETKFVRAKITLHYGDIAQSAWSEKYNFIQEAYAGINIYKNMLWLDAGFFRSHIGMESIQPRENFTNSLSTTTYFEPYYLSGAKLSYAISSKHIIQLQIFNGFNSFIETNNSKAYGLSYIFTQGENFSLNYNLIYCDESAKGQINQPRFYQNVFALYKGSRWDAGLEFNTGIQQHTSLKDTSTAYVFSANAIARYKFKNKRVFIFGRAEVFEDSDEMLTGPVQNEHHVLVGINAIGGTLGVEFKPHAKSYVRLEHRLLVMSDNEKIFNIGNDVSNYRNESSVCMGFWF